MALLQMLSLFTPIVIYFVLVYFVFEFSIGFHFFLGLIGSFLIGVGIYKKVESKIWKFDSRAPFVMFTLGATVVSLSLLLAKNQMPIDDEVAFDAVLRIVMLAILIIDYVIFQAYLKGKVRVIFNIVMASCLVILGVVVVTFYFVSSFATVYFYMFLIAAICSSLLNVYCTIKKNLYYHKAAFVLFKRIDGWNKHTDIFSDMLFILLPIILAIVQMM